jgi:hypothetical protein
MPTLVDPNSAVQALSRPALPMLPGPVPVMPPTLPSPEPVPAQPSPELRDFGMEMLKDAMWKKLGVDYMSGPFSGPYDDSPTAQEIQRQRNAGHFTADDLKRENDKMEMLELLSRGQHYELPTPKNTDA